MTDDQLKRALTIADRFQIHVKLLEDGDLPNHRILPYDTHYLMRGAEIIHVGTRENVISYLHRFEQMQAAQTQNT